MLRMALGLGSVAILVLAGAGCQMCCHPYDKCGPVFSDDGCSSSTHSRAGSILAGSLEPSMAVTTSSNHGQPASPSPTPAQAKKPQKSISYVMAGKRADSPSPTPVQAKKPQKPISYVMGGKRPEGPLLGPAQPGDVPGSERIVSVTERVLPSADPSQAAAEASSESSKPLPPSGWSARRPDD